MTYIPDFRKETNKLNEKDKEFIAGYRCAIEDAKTFFDNTDVYEASEAEEKVLQEAKGCFEDWMEMEETEVVLSLFESGDYEDLDLVDGNEPLYTNTKGSKK